MKQNGTVSTAALCLLLALCGLFLGNQAIHAAAHGSPHMVGAGPAQGNGFLYLPVIVRPGAPNEQPNTLRLTSAAFVEGATIPAKHTCTSNNLSPALEWTTVPSNTQDLALIMEDPDAPGGTFVHWVLYNIQLTVSLAEGIGSAQVAAQAQPVWGQDQLANFTRGKNSAASLAYFGPCPPPGPPHRYIFTLYALDEIVNLPEGATAQEVRQEIAGKIIAEARLMGRFGR